MEGDSNGGMTGEFGEWGPWEFVYAQYTGRSRMHVCRFIVRLHRAYLEIGSMTLFNTIGPSIFILGRVMRHVMGKKTT